MHTELVRYLMVQWLKRAPRGHEIHCQWSSRFNTVIPLSKHSSIPSDSGMKVTTWKLPQPNNKFSEASGIGFDEDFIDSMLGSSWMRHGLKGSQSCSSRCFCNFTELTIFSFTYMSHTYQCLIFETQYYVVIFVYSVAFYYFIVCYHEVS